MPYRKRTWKFWLSGTLLTVLLIVGVWLINLVWFRPFNIKHFYDRTFVVFALQSPETVTQLGIPVIYDWTKDKLDDVLLFPEKVEKAKETIAKIGLPKKSGYCR